MLAASTVRLATWRNFASVVALHVARATDLASSVVERNAALAADAGRKLGGHLKFLSGVAPRDCANSRRGILMSFYQGSKPSAA